MHSLSAESCDGESEDLMEAVKEGKRAATATNESGWDGGLGVCVCVDSAKQHEKQINTKKKKKHLRKAGGFPLSMWWKLMLTFDQVDWRGSRVICPNGYITY